MIDAARECFPWAQENGRAGGSDQHVLDKGKVLPMSVYDLITARVVSLLEAGVAPWRKPWGGARLWPRNLVSGHCYRGVNVFLTACSGYSSPYWLTYKQAQAI